jgi:hypothetical protein
MRDEKEAVDPWKVFAATHPFNVVRDAEHLPSGEAALYVSGRQHFPLPVGAPPAEFAAIAER